MVIGEGTGNNGRRLPGNYIDSLRTLVKRLKILMLEGWEEENKEEGKQFCKSIDKVTEECKICQKYKSNPSKPVVGFSISKHFNKALTKNVGEFEKHKFVLMVDH